jgi:hypothetical protein
MTLVPLNRFALATSAAMVVLAAAVLGGSAGAAARSNATSTSLCTAAKGVAHQLVQSANITANESLTPAQLKSIYTTIVNAEPSLLAASSGPIKTHLRLALTFVNLVDADFKKANWKVAALMPQLPTLLPAAKKAQPHLNALKTYFDSTCHLGV